MKEQEKLNLLAKAREETLTEAIKYNYKAYDTLIAYQSALSRNGLTIVKQRKGKIQ